MKTLFLMCAPPASGKSTYIKNKLEDEYKNEKAICISRDQVRFSMIQNNDEYFSKEPQVFKEFIRQINEAIMEYNIIFVDATHINQRSRNKVLDALHLEDVDVIPIAFKISLETCLDRNRKREGRACVPDSAMYDMFNHYTIPTFKEKYKYKDIYII